ncbi:MAG TPA: VPLPA-CTERM-specific exosortase XrtD [Steroidobacteraceae bacterium]|jgi:exosortase D (VPLPA-CTERM-specific)
MQPRLQGSQLQIYSLLAVALVAAVVPFAGVLSDLYNIWNLKPEYSHGIMIPVLSAFLIWRQRAQLRTLPFTGSWLGIVLIVAGMLLRLLGVQTTMQTLQHYAFLFVLYGLVLALTGPVVFRRLWMPLLMLVFAVPLPSFFNTALSLQLQLLSSQIGVWIIRAAGISVLLEGNVIDLGSYQLEVAEACSGLRYLFPLMTLGFIVAYLFRGPMWKRITIFLVTIPITVLMNSLRIGFIGITVDRWGRAMAEGALHDFEGWVVFMFSTAALILIAVGLTRLGRSRTSWADAFDLTGTAARAKPTQATGAGGSVRKEVADPVANSPAEAASPVAVQAQKVPRPFMVAAVVVVLGALTGGVATPSTRVATPPRVAFDAFPSTIGTWSGRRASLEKFYLDALRLDDYVLLDYHSAAGADVNFYSAYYESQDSRREVHSPHDCIPGGGWEITHMENKMFPATAGQAAFPYNRAIIQLGTTRQIVYYWFQERGRHLTNEYVTRWYLFWDALTRHRTDGALVRFVAPYPQGTKEADVDAKIMALAGQIVPTLPQYIPN